MIRSWTRIILGSLAALFLFTALWITRDGYGLSIDEATHVWVAREERDWFREFSSRPMATSFSHETLREKWHFLEPPGSVAGGHSNFNLPAATHLMNLGWLAFHWWAPELDTYRLASMILFSLAVGWTLAHFTHRQGMWTGIGSAGSLALMPRLFGHAHLAATETALCSGWLAVLLMSLRLDDRRHDDRADESTLRRLREPLILSLGVGFVMSVKMTAWLLWPVTLAWLMLHRPVRWREAVLFTLIVPWIVIVLITPPLWRYPLSGLVTAVQVAARHPWAIATTYGGVIYSGNPPWYSSPHLLFVSIPIAVLASALLATIGGVRLAAVRLLLFHMAVLGLARFIGLMPGHDGDRQFVAVYVVVALLAGQGIGMMCRWVENCRWERRRACRVAAGLLLAAFIAEPMADTIRYRHAGLMYYNRLVGGLRGATQAGFETSYWFEGMTSAMWHDLLEPLPAGTRVFMRPDHPGLALLQEWNIVRPDLRFVGSAEESDVYLLYGKRAAYRRPDLQGEITAPTRLWQRQQYGDALASRERDGVRIVALVPARQYRTTADYVNP